MYIKTYTIYYKYHTYILHPIRVAIYFPLKIQSVDYTIKITL